MLSLNLSLHWMLPFGSCISLFYQSKIITTKVCISTESLWLNQNGSFFYKAFCFCPTVESHHDWQLCAHHLCAGCPAAGHREGWGWAHTSPGIPGDVSQPHGHRGTMSTAVLLLGMCQAGLKSTTATPKGPSLSKPIPGSTSRQVKADELSLGLCAHLLLVVQGVQLPKPAAI